MWVTVVSSEQPPQSVRVGERKRVLGRAPTCDVVIDLEHSGHGADAATQGDAGVSDAARAAVLDAHVAICVAKSKL